MTKRRNEQPHVEFMQSFTSELKRDVKESLQVWQTLNREQAVGRQAAYAHIVFLLKRTADAHGIALADLGLVDYEVPRIQDLE